jgi:DNA-binding transcriptional MerR regulator
VKESRSSEPSTGLTTGDVARLTGIPQQTLISWDRSGVLKASRPGRRSSSRAPRRYDEAALEAALFAREAMQMGFRGEALGQMVRLFQRGERGPLERAGIFTYRTYPGMMKHIFSPDLAHEDDRRWVEYLREHHSLVGEPTTLWSIHEHLVGPAQKLFRMPELRDTPLPESRR